MSRFINVKTGETPVSPLPVPPGGRCPGSRSGRNPLPDGKVIESKAHTGVEHVMEYR